MIEVFQIVLGYIMLVSAAVIYFILGLTTDLFCEDRTGYHEDELTIGMGLIITFWPIVVAYYGLYALAPLLSRFVIWCRDQVHQELIKINIGLEYMLRRWIK